MGFPAKHIGPARCETDVVRNNAYVGGVSSGVLLSVEIRKSQKWLKLGAITAVEIEGVSDIFHDFYNGLARHLILSQQCYFSTAVTTLVSQHCCHSTAVSDPCQKYFSVLGFMTGATLFESKESPRGVSMRCIFMCTYTHLTCDRLIFRLKECIRHRLDGCAALSD